MKPNCIVCSNRIRVNHPEIPCASSCVMLATAELMNMDYRHTSEGDTGTAGATYIYEYVDGTQLVIDDVSVTIDMEVNRIIHRPFTPGWPVCFNPASILECDRFTPTS